MTKAVKLDPIFKKSGEIISLSENVF